MSETTVTKIPLDFDLNALNMQWRLQKERESEVNAARRKERAERRANQPQQTKQTKQKPAPKQTKQQPKKGKTAGRRKKTVESRPVPTMQLIDELVD